MNSHIERLQQINSGAVDREGKMKVTVVLKKSERKIVYLESNKDFVDVLMSFLLLPIGSSMKLVHGDAKAGVAKVFSSVKQMDDALMQGDKKVLVDPKPPEGFMEAVLGVEQDPRLTATPPPFKPSEHSYYRCSSGRPCPEISMDDNTRRCSTCGYVLSMPVQVVAPPQAVTHQPVLPKRPGVSSRGFVKENVSFAVTDDLQIYPVSVSKSIALLNAYKVEAVSDIETVELDVGPAEVLQLLKTSLTSMTVLNDVFQSRLPKLPAPTPAPTVLPTQTRLRYP